MLQKRILGWKIELAKFKETKKLLENTIFCKTKFHTVNWKTQNSFNTVSDAVNSDGQTGCKKEENSLFSPLLKLCNSPIRFDFSQFKMSKLNLEMVFCYQNCSDLLWEKIVLVIEICKNFEIARTIYSKS